MSTVTYDLEVILQQAINTPAWPFRHASRNKAVKFLAIGTGEDNDY